jgi:hypothetical protein
MKIGCFGCLTLIVLVLIVVVGGLGFIFLSGNILDTPEVRPVKFTRGDGYSAQQKLYELVLRQSGRSSRRDAVALTEQEANAFLANHLVEAGDLPMDPLMVRFRRGRLELTGRTPMRHLLQGPPFAQLLPYVKDARVDTPIWVTVKGRIVIEPTAAGASRSYGRLDVTEFALGKQDLGAWLLNVMLGSTASRLTRWQVPSVVEEVKIEDGKALILTR